MMPRSGREVFVVLPENFYKILIKLLQIISGRMKRGTLRLLLALGEEERLGDLASRLGLHVSTVWRHAKELERTGLVSLENGEIRLKRALPLFPHLGIREYGVGPQRVTPRCQQLDTWEGFPDWEEPYRYSNTSRHQAADTSISL